MAVAKERLMEMLNAAGIRQDELDKDVEVSAVPLPFHHTLLSPFPRHSDSVRKLPCCACITWPTSHQTAYDFELGPIAHAHSTDLSLTQISSFHHFVDPNGHPRGVRLGTYPSPSSYSSNFRPSTELKSNSRLHSTRLFNS